MFNLVGQSIMYIMWLFAFYLNTLLDGYGYTIGESLEREDRKMLTKGHKNEIQTETFYELVIT